MDDSRENLRGPMETLFSDSLNWEARGYSAAPTPPDDPKLRENPDRALWLRLEQILGQCKQGNFLSVVEILDLYKNATTAVFQYVCSRVVGDAGTNKCFERMIRELEIQENENINTALDYCSAFRSWGALSCVPVLVRQYERFRPSRSSHIIPIYLSSLLEAKWDAIVQVPGKGQMPAYRNLVMSRYLQIKEQYKTDRVIILEGEEAGVKRYAKLLLERLGDDEFNRVSQPFLRRKFEASTGIDCSGFYKEKRFQPLVAAALLEEFLESGQAEKYKDGVRYFFGHRIPD